MARNAVQHHSPLPTLAVREDERWEPSSRDLAAELPALMRRLSADGFEMHRVVFNPADWGNPPRRLAIGGRIVKLGAYNTQRPGTIVAVDSTGWNRVTVHDDSPKEPAEVIQLPQQAPSAR